jgi:dolichol-phosphate mannosyltransferase
MKKEKISVIMPCYNEEHGIKANAQEMLSYLEGFGYPYELILVNDGSVDSTAHIIDKLAASNQHVIAAHHRRNRGRGAGLRTGFAQATGDFIFTFDADLSYAPYHIERMLYALEKQKADIVIASCYNKKGTVKNVPFFRAFMSRWGNKLLTMGSKLTVITCVVRGYRKEVLDSIELFSEGKEIHMEIISKASDMNYRIVEVPADLHWRKSKQLHKAPARRSTFKLVGQSLMHLQYLFTETPFLLLGVLAALLIIAGLIIGGFIISEWLKHSLVPDRPLVTLMVILLIAGLQVMLFSLLAQQNRSLRREIIHTQSMIKKK